jgi:hypothetical protein
MIIAMGIQKYANAMTRLETPIKFVKRGLLVCDEHMSKKD